MSKFLDALCLESTGRRFVKRDPKMRLELAVMPSVARDVRSLMVCQEYQAQIDLKWRVKIENNDSARYHALKAIKRRLAYEIYHEFRDALFELETLYLNDGDTIKVREKFEEIYKMIGVCDDES